MNKRRKVLITITYNEMGIIIDTKAEEVAQPNLQSTCNELATDCISRQSAINALECVGYDFSESGLSNLELEEVCEAVGEVRDDMVKRIRHLPSAQPEQRWIPLGRPMNSGRYLVTLRQKFEGEESYRVRIMRLNNGRWVLPKHFPEWINEEMEQEVLAWMPLPEPYKEDQCNGCSYLDGACVGEGCGKLTDREDGENNG